MKKRRRSSEDIESRSTVQRYLERLKAAGLSWPLPSDLDDVALERRLYPPPPVASPEERCLPDCAPIHKGLKSRKNVTLQLLWEEYKQAHPLWPRPSRNRAV
jgi:transposase